jgi:hypothetical protein
MCALIELALWQNKWTKVRATARARRSALTLSPHADSEATRDLAITLQASADLSDSKQKDFGASVEAMITDARARASRVNQFRGNLR